MAGDAVPADCRAACIAAAHPSFVEVPGALPRLLLRRRDCKEAGVALTEAPPPLARRPRAGDIEKIAAPALFLCAETDQVFQEKHRRQAEEILRKKEGARAEFVVYPGTQHGFAVSTQPSSLPLTHMPPACRRRREARSSTMLACAGGGGAGEGQLQGSGDQGGA